MTVSWVVWDAAAAWVVDRLEQEGVLPALSRLRAAGVRAAAQPPRPNCQTPPSLATLFTGTPSQEHGISGFIVPAGDHEPAARERSGFDPCLLRRPPVWARDELAGVTSSFVHAPWVFDADGRVAAGVQGATEAYSRRLAAAALVPLGDAPASWPVGDHDVTVEVRDGAAYVITRAGCLEVPADGRWVQVRLTVEVGFWVARARRWDGEPVVVRTGAWATRTAGADASLVGRLRACDVFAGEGIGTLYRSGVFGPRMVDGGDGVPEQLLLGSLSCVARSFASAARAVLAGPRPDLLVVYLPFTDDIGHEVLGWCDRDSAAYRPDVAGPLWEVVRRCYTWADDLLGEVLDVSTCGDTTLLTADHGIVGSAWLVHPNEALLKAGLAARDRDGQLDIRRSPIVYHPANNGELVVNVNSRPEGCVSVRDAADFLSEAMKVLLAVPRPAGATDPVVRGFLGADGEALSPDKLPFGTSTAFIVLSDDYQPNADFNDGQIVRPMAKSAAHVVNTGTPRLLATFAASGPGLPAGVDWGAVDNTVAAALVASALDQPTPAAFAEAVGAGGAQS